MILIWKEKLRARRTRAYRTGELYRSIINSMTFRHDPEYLSMNYQFQFRAYGIYVERGTGREVFRGNNGDIGRQNRRHRRRWNSPKLYMSVYNIRDFLAEAVGRDFVDIMADMTEK